MIAPRPAHKLDCYVIVDYTWPAALTVNDTFPPPLVCRHIIFVFVSETVSPNAEHAVTIEVYLFLAKLFSE